MKIRTLVLSVVAAVLVATMVTGTALARGPRTPGDTGTGGRGSAGAPFGRGFVDEDGDGVNDRYAEGDGAPDCDGTGMGRGYGFVDEDGDGVNDRYAECDGTPDYDGTGMGRGYGFVDEDGDGVNDRYEEGEGLPGCDGQGAMGPRESRGGRWSR